MGIISAFKWFGRKIFNGIKFAVRLAIPKNDKERDDFFNSLKEIAVPIIENVGRFDLNGDGRIAAANEIITALEKNGLIYGKSLFEKGRSAAYNALTQHIPTSDLRRYLAAARIVTAVADKLPILPVQLVSRVVNGLIESVLVDELAEK